MPVPLFPSLLGATVALVTAGVWAQAIQRCEGADGRVAYAEGACPPGTRAVRAIAAPARPSAEAQKEARERAQRDREVAQALAAQRQPAAAARTGQRYIPVEEARRAADCAYLRAELDSNRRLRNVLTTRPYYSMDDVDQMDANEAALAADYRRFCTR
jgi:hypothetical protein